jgi:hypothetical protein
MCLTTHLVQNRHENLDPVTGPEPTAYCALRASRNSHRHMTGGETGLVSQLSLHQELVSVHRLRNSPTDRRIELLGG